MWDVCLYFPRERWLFFPALPCPVDSGGPGLPQALFCFPLQMQHHNFSACWTALTLIYRTVPICLTFPLEKSQNIFFKSSGIKVFSQNHSVERLFTSELYEGFLPPQGGRPVNSLCWHPACEPIAAATLIPLSHNDLCNQFHPPPLWRKILLSCFPGTDIDM